MRAIYIHRGDEQKRGNGEGRGEKHRASEVAARKPQKLSTKNVPPTSRRKKVRKKRGGCVYIVDSSLRREHRWKGWGRGIRFTSYYIIYYIYIIIPPSCTSTLLPLGWSRTRRRNNDIYILYIYIYIYTYIHI